MANNMQYRIVEKLYDSDNTMVGYLLQDINGKKSDVSINDIKILVRQGLIHGVTIDKYGNLKGSYDIDLRKLKHTKIFSDTLSTFEIDDEIKTRFNTVSNYKRRTVFTKIENYLMSNTPKICAIYGLRRTGKTVLLLQAIDSLGYDSCAFISLNKNDKSLNLIKELNRCYQKGIKYIFIDEITVLNDLLYFIQTLSDNYAMKGMRIVISGTDSYMLNIASQNELYNRCEMVRTTYISFREYNYLLGKTEIKEYISKGGVLNRDVFYDTNSMHAYLDTAISENIQHSVEVCGRKKFGRFYDLIDMGLFKKCIEQSIQRTNEELTSYIMAKEFKSQDVGSVAQLLSSSMDISSLLDIETISEQIRYYLRVCNIGGNNEQNTVLFDEYYDTVMQIFKALNLIVYVQHYIGRRVSKDTLFVLPGLRYNQLKETILFFIQNDTFQDLAKRDRNKIIDKLESDVYGQLMEQVVLLQMLVDYGEDKVYKFNGVSGEEIDCIVEVNNTEIDLIEVKWSENVVERQCVHLINKDFNQSIYNTLKYNIRKRIVLYRGKTCDMQFNGYTVNYINVNSFLIKPKKYL